MLPLYIHTSRAWTLRIRFAPRAPQARISRRFFSSDSTDSTHSTITSTTWNEQEYTVPRKFVPHPFSYREEKTLRVSSLTNLGFGVCRTTIDAPSDMSNDENDTPSSKREWVVFVPNVIPGELVHVRIYRNFKNYSEADLLQVVEPSPDRQEPRCNLSGTCGGCQYQHMHINAQREWKTQHVQEVLERVGGFEHVDVTPTVGSPEIFHYRSKLTPHYDRPRKLSDDSYEIEVIGFKQKSSRQLVDVPYCPIATEAINEELAKLRDAKRLEALNGSLRRPKRGATLLLRDVEEGVCLDPNQQVTTTVSGIKFQFLAGNFFQNNPYMLPIMVDHVVDAATKPSRRDGTAMTHLIDCYCGSGLFCLTAAVSFDVCVGIEVNERAVAEASDNARLNDIKNCAFVAASAEAIFESIQPVSLPSLEKSCLVNDFPRDRTVVVVDPPRKGCSEEFLSQLYEFGPQRVVYMSCDPATQARDARGIVDNGYDMTSIQPFDLFPQTRHIESLIIFERQT
jgi:23S rRNA (uracil1939-C5)-methyltransferase/tRNA (uracil-5-)-methyltransferase